MGDIGVSVIYVGPTSKTTPNLRYPCLSWLHKVGRPQYLLSVVADQYIILQTEDPRSKLSFHFKKFF